MPDDHSRRSLAILAVSATTFVWGWPSVLVKLTSLSGLTFAMFRLWMGVLVHLTVLAVTRRRLSWATFRVCALGGVLFATEISLTFSAVKLTAVANAAIIGALAPVFIVLVAGRMFGERVGRREMALVLVSLAGVALVAIGASGSPAWSPVGDALAGVGTLAWTAYWVFSKRARATASALEYMTSVMLAGALAITPVALLAGRPSAPEPRDWVVLITVTLIPGAAGHLMVAWSHRYVESWLSALITQCAPVVTAVGAWVVLDEPLARLSIAGGLLVLAATGLVIASAARRGRTRLAAEELETAVERPA